MMSSQSKNLISVIVLSVDITSEYACIRTASDWLYDVEQKNVISGGTAMGSVENQNDVLVA